MKIFENTKTKNKYLIVIGVFILAFGAWGTLRSAPTGTVLPFVSGSTIYGCVKPTGEIYLVGPGLGQTVCLANHQPIKWNSRGDQGPAGPQGPAGISIFPEAIISDVQLIFQWQDGINIGVGGITWNTDIPSTTRLFISTTSPVPQIQENERFMTEPYFVQNHGVGVENLQQDLVYYFIIHSMDTLGRPVISEEYSFQGNILNIP